MKYLLSLAVAALPALLTGLGNAQTWQTVDDFQYVAGQDSGNTGLATAPNGTLLATGWAYDTNGFEHGLVIASADGGDTWSAPLDDFGGDELRDAAYNAVGSSPAGDLYAGGNMVDYSADFQWSTNHWVVRRSTDGGATWSTADEYNDGDDSTTVKAISADASGNVFVAGINSGGWVVRKGIGGTNFITVDSGLGISAANAVYAHPTAGLFAAGFGPISSSTSKRGQVTTYTGWLVRRSTNGGATWSSVDQFTLSNEAIARGICADALGNIYVVGFADAASGTPNHQTLYSHWIVRKSTDGGKTWSTVDDALMELRPSLAYGPAASAAACGTDSKGNVYAAGWDYTSAGPLHWIVRMSPGGSGPWQTVDDFQLLTGYNSVAAAVAANASGNVFVGGSGWNGGSHWLVRKH